jgi:signal recognition particle GTPase
VLRFGVLNQKIKILLTLLKKPLLMLKANGFNVVIVDTAGRLGR